MHTLVRSILRRTATTATATAAAAVHTLNRVKRLHMSAAATATTAAAAGSNSQANANAKKKVIAVLGATGQQGGSVVDALHRDGTFAVRAITRDAKSDKALALAKRYPGVEVVSGDLKDQKSLATAFAGAHGAFIVTLPNFGSADMKEEVDQGTNAVDAALSAKVSHIVLSTLPSGQKVAGVLVPHFDAKWRIAEYLMSHARGNNSAKHNAQYTNVLIPYFMENFQSPWFGAKPDAADPTKLAFAVPMAGKPMAVSSVAAYGSVIAPIFKDSGKFDGQKFDGKLVNYDGEISTLQQYVNTFTRVTGKPAVAHDLSLDVFKAFPNQSHELVVMFELYHRIAGIRAKGQNPYTTPLGVKESDYIPAQSFVKTMDFEGWLKQTGWHQQKSTPSPAAAVAATGTGTAK